MAIRGRLAWYWRRIQRKPATIRFQHGDAWFLATLDARPSWRKPRPVTWEQAGWHELGYTTDDPD